MANKIFLRAGAWYRAAAKFLSEDMEVTEIIEDVNEQYPSAESSTGGGGSTTLQQAIDNGAVLDKDNGIDVGQNYLKFNNGTQFYFEAANVDGSISSFLRAFSTTFTIAVFNDTDSCQLNMGATSATIDRGGAGAKPIATIAVADDFADDAAAATGGIAVGSLYHTSGAVKVRLT